MPLDQATIIQINATVIAGALVLLTVNAAVDMTGNALLTFMLVSLQKTIYDINGIKPAKFADEVN